MFIVKGPLQKSRVHAAMNAARSNNKVGLLMSMLLLIAIAFSLSSCVSALPVHGTLVIGVPPNEGLLIVSDRLRHSEERGYDDTTEKVIRISPTAAVAFTGTVGMVETGTLDGKVVGQRERMFVKEFVQTYFSTNSISSPDWKQFSAYIRDKVDRYLRTFSPLRLKDTSQSILFQIAVFRVQPSRTITIFVLKVIYSKRGSELTIAVDGSESSIGDHDQAAVTALGNAELLLELRSGTDSRFSSLRANTVIRTFVPTPPQISAARLSDATAFARLVMKEASTQTKLLNPDADIGV